MKRILLLCVPLMLTLMGMSQSHDWYYSYNTAKSEKGYDIVYGADGYIYVGGVEYDDTDYDIVVIKLDKSGTQQWVYLYEGQTDKPAEISEIRYGSDGNIYVCGWSSNSAGDDKFLVFSLNPAGSFRWDYYYDITGAYTSFAHSVVYGENGMVYAAGQANYDFLVVAINGATGTEEWTYWFDGGCPYALCDDIANAVALGSDGTVYVAGYTLATTEKQMVIVSLNPDGNLNWKYIHPAYNIGSSMATDVVFGKDGRIYASCVIASDIGAICLNTAGEYQWNCNIDGPGPEPTFGETCYEVLYGIDENIYVVGRAAGRDPQVDTDLDMAVLKVNRQGEPEWFYRYEGLYGTFDMAFSIVQTPDTNVHIAGYSCGLLAEANMISLHHQTGRDLWVMRYVGPATDMDVAYAVTADEDGYVYLTGYDYKANRLHDLYVYKINPPRNTDGYYNLEGYGTAGCGYAILESPDKNIVIAGGQGSSYLNNSYDMRLIKTDINGDTLWTRNYGGTDEDKAYDVAVCPDNGFILTGYTKSFGVGGKDLYLVKTDANGIIEWENYYGYETDEEGVSITVASDGGYFIAGKTFRYDGAGDLWFMKVNAQGDSLWTKVYGGDRRDEVGQVHTTTDGGFIFAGTKGTFLTTYYVTNMYVIRFTADGDTLWTREFVNNNYDDYGFDIIEQTDGSFIVAGYYTWSDGLAKLGPDGAVLWEKTYPGNGFNTISRNKDGNYLVSKSELNFTPTIYVATVDHEGNILHADTVFYNYTNVGEALCVCPITEGDWVTTGSGKIWGDGMFNWNIILYRKGGNLTPLPLPPLGINEFPFPTENNTIPSVQITPNPVTQKALIGFNLESASAVIITISDVDGRTVYQSAPTWYSAGNQKFEWMPGDLSNGVYVCRITAVGRNLSGKIMLIQN